MKFKSKIVFIIIVIFSFFITVSLIFVVISLNERAKKGIVEYEANELKKTENSLQNYVDIGYMTVKTNYENATDKKYLTKFYGDRLVNITNIIEQTLLDKVDQVKRGKLSLAKAKKEATELINKYRYHDGNGYIWIMTNEAPFPRMIIEPIKPLLNGQVLNDSTFLNSDGTKNIFTECYELCNDSTGDGFVNFIWIKPTENQESNNKATIDVPKFGYVKLFKEWNWIIGTGIYLDDAIKEAKIKSKSDLRNINWDNNKGYYWINDDTRPTPRLIMNAQWAAGEGKIHTDKRFNCAFGEDINLYEAFLSKSLEGDGGFVDYPWDKSLGKGLGKVEDAPKQSYVKYFKPLGWVIGSGVYIDDIYSEINKKKEQMNEERKEMIVNYLLISLSLAGMSITILILTMNKHFKKSDKATTNHKKEQKTSIPTSQKLKKLLEDDNKTKQAEPTTQIIVDKNEDQSVTEEAGKLLKIFLAEQTKLLAYTKTLEYSEKTNIDKEIKELTENIKLLTKQISKTMNSDQ